MLTACAQIPVSNNHLLNIVSILHELVLSRNVSLADLLRTAPAPPSEDTLPASSQPAAATAEDAAAPQNESDLAAEAAALWRSEMMRHSASAPDMPAAEAVAEAAPPPTLPAALATALRACKPLVGDDYYRAKAQLLDAEQQLLRLLQWRLAVPHPAAALLHAAAALGAPPALTAAALAVLNDVTAFTDLLLPSPNWPNLAGNPAQHSKLQNDTTQTHGNRQGGERGHGPAARCMQGKVEQADSDVWGWPAGGILEQEVVIAVSCLLVASEVLDGDCTLQCAECRRDGRDEQADAPGRTSETGQGVSLRCEHWVRVLGVDPSVVRVVAAYILERVSAAREGVEQWRPP